MKDQNEKQYIFEMSRLDYEGQGKLEGKCFPSEKYFYSFDPDTDKMRICVPESDRKKVMMRMKKFKVKRFLVDCIFYLFCVLTTFLWLNKDCLSFLV